uniref:Uncharacterized protein n=1 Tax=Vespula pensylvanica TaxID=30213 RepID=A0A834P1B2_VESPE|nr:hypothetical protein H0235_008850 [Vespula pensylvanica]
MPSKFIGGKRENERTREQEREREREREKEREREYWVAATFRSSSSYHSVDGIDPQKLWLLARSSVNSY